MQKGVHKDLIKHLRGCPSPLMDTFSKVFGIRMTDDLLQQPCLRMPMTELIDWFPSSFRNAQVRMYWSLSIISSDPICRLDSGHCVSQGSQSRKSDQCQDSDREPSRRKRGVD